MVIVIGGAGYVGSHVCKYLGRAGVRVEVIDNLSTGNRSSVLGKRLHVIDILNRRDLDSFFKENAADIDVVMHFAAKSLVSESIDDPAVYYRNNVDGVLNVLDAMHKNNINNFVFSSTAATFGEPEYLPIDENHSQKPINPYGRSKLMVEEVLKDYSSAYGINSVSLRYFNACGADPENEIGEMHDPETHLLPLILQAASGRRSDICVFGRDYDTPDGTCIRDYVHVMDLYQAHEAAMRELITSKKKGAFSYNLGNGSGFSVQEVIDVARKVVAEDNKTIKVIDKPRRCGDPARLVADSTIAKQELRWIPRFAELEVIIRHAWAWEKKVAGL
ncbi:UDP-glucose 4-epimerase GalE [Salinicola salarius]|uniref:UDP-glucose 4-epimerase GalE n=1 Tax=Salinicola salarius TaxID=430457 RepID=UPI0023E365A4|nr:UDP-glucose 4-epimerase GalE [Salinicola salarius]MDF3917783.1 UDP-glucose 4-epimerase GalE [Salinicola salarius]